MPKLRILPLVLSIAVIACSDAQPVAPSAPIIAAAGKGQDKKKPPVYAAFSGTVPLVASQWTLTGSGAPPLTSLSFALPTVGYAGYLYFNAAQWALTAGQVLSATYTITASPDAAFRVSDQPGQNCYPPPVGGGYYPQATLVLWTTSFDYSEYTRWWAMDTMTPLANGTFTLSQAISPSRFMSALGKYGTDAPSIWNDALNHVVGVGLTLGGGCDLSHGIALTAGSASFALTNYRIQ